ncbi:MAG: hypothetical protein ABIQ12_05300, partial [Opitutaceae bacterium]
ASVRPGWFVLAVLALALLLRLYLVAEGGAYYWTDEKRYNDTREAVGAIVERDVAGAAHFLLSKSDHIGFRWMALPPAIAERIGHDGAPPTARLCAGYFSLFGTANLFLIWLIARRRGASEWEAAIALSFAAASNALFYFSRHCLPYDAALTFFLWAIYYGSGPERRGRPLGVGVLCGLGYLTYNGYWSVGAVVLILEVAGHAEWWLARLRRGALALAGLLAPLVMIGVIARLAGYNFVADSLAFAGTVNQGDFGEGWRFIPEYLWTADGALPVGLVALVLVGMGAAVRRGRAEPWLRWVAALALLLAIWLLLSDVFHRFMLYGRTVRAAVPFLALAAGGAAASLRETSGKKFRQVMPWAAAVLCAAGIWRMIPPLRQVFPADFRRLAQREIAAATQRTPPAVFQTLYADYLYDYDFPEPPPPHREFLRQTHPHRYAPYLFEGYTRDQRPRYMAHDTAMRLIELDQGKGHHWLKSSAGARSLNPYPGPLAIALRLPVGRTGSTETLLRHGGDGEHRDTILIRYVDATRLRLGLRHAPDQPVWSDAIEYDPATEHTITVSLGSFFPPAGDERLAHAPEVAPLRDRQVIRFDGRTALAGSGEFQPATLDHLHLGGNAAPGDAEQIPFSGAIRAVRRLDPRTAADREALASADQVGGFPPVQGPQFGDFHGTIEMLVTFPTGAPAGTEPLLASGRSGAGDQLYVTYPDERHIRLGLDHWGAPGLQSAPLEIQPGVPQRLAISFGALFPRPNDPRYGESPQLRVLQKWLYVRLNDEVVFSQPFVFHPAETDAVRFGRGLAGGSIAANFTGRIVAITHRRPDDFGLEERTLRWPRLAGPTAGNAHLGFIELKIRLAETWDPGFEPLLIAGDGAESEVVFLRFRGSRQLQMGYRRGNGPAELSPPIPTTPGASHTIAVSLPSLHPGASGDASPSEMVKLRVSVTVDGRPALSLVQPPAFAAPGAVFFGRNPAELRGLRPRFAGTILEVRTLTVAGE